MITQERLKELLHYDPETGVFTRLEKVKFTTGEVGSSPGWVDAYGYLCIQLDGKTYGAHRLAWLYVYGVFPEPLADHKDRNTLNNRIGNLREATRSANAMNKGTPTNNTSGFKGVYWCERLGKFKAMCSVKGTQHYLGLHTTAERASEVYQAFARQHFGEFYHLPK